jgi:hypothetical protein
VESMTYQQASALVDEYAKQTAPVFPKGASLSLLQKDAVACSNSDDPPPGTPVNIAAVYWVNGLVVSDNKSYLDTVVAYWQTKGWRQVRDDRPQRQVVAVAAANGFEIIVQLTADGSRLSLTTSSPCVPPEPAQPSSSG